MNRSYMNHNPNTEQSDIPTRPVGDGTKPKPVTPPIDDDNPALWHQVDGARPGVQIHQRTGRFRYQPKTPYAAR
jgi:hypothetical protein